MGIASKSFCCYGQMYCFLQIKSVLETMYDRCQPSIRQISSWDFVDGNTISDVMAEKKGGGFVK